MRGHHHFQKLFEEEPKPKINTPKSRGRSKILYAKRNELIADRYYYYGKLLNKRYIEVNSILVDEFLISSITIAELLDKVGPYIRQLKAKKMDAKQLAAKWPHFNWKTN